MPANPPGRHTPRKLPWTSALAASALLLAFFSLPTLHPSILELAAAPVCPRTKIFPFAIGCPLTCTNLRPDVRRPMPEFFLSVLSFELGNLDVLRNGSASTSSVPADAFLRRFLPLEDRVFRDIDTAVLAAGLRPLEHVYQRAMHLSLSYLCCLTGAEAALAGEVAGKWARRMDLGRSVTFHRVSCLRVLPDFVTVIVEVSPSDERAIHLWNRAVERELVDAGVPVPVHRKEQMVFHVTLLGVRAPGGDAEAYGGLICKAVRGIGRVEGAASLGPVLDVTRVAQAAGEA